MNGGERRGVFLFFFSLSQHCGNEFSLHELRVSTGACRSKLTKMSVRFRNIFFFRATIMAAHPGLEYSRKSARLRATLDGEAPSSSHSKVGCNEMLTLARILSRL